MVKKGGKGNGDENEKRITKDAVKRYTKRAFAEQRQSLKTKIGTAGRRQSLLGLGLACWIKVRIVEQTGVQKRGFAEQIV